MAHAAVRADLLQALDGLGALATQIALDLEVRVDVPLENATIEFGRVRAPAKGTPRYLRAAMGQPNALITLGEPASVHRAYGRPRPVDRIGLVLDDPNGFEAAWRSFAPEAPDSRAAELI